MSNIRKVISTYLEVNGDKVCCPFHGEKTPSLMIYDDTESFHCYGCGEDGDAIDFVKTYNECGFVEAKQTVLDILNLDDSDWKNSKISTEGKRVTIEKYEPMDLNEVREFIATVGYVSNGYRGIRDDINKFFGHLTKLDEDGEPTKRYYPETNPEGKLTGYKCRNLPKDFSHGNIGKTGSKSQLSGQVKFKTGGRFILIVGGEEDKAAAYQMLIDSQKDMDYNSIPVVSPTTGELSAAKQCAANYEFLDMFDNIIIGMDNDEAGKKAALAIAEVLPKHKVKIVSWTGKDPNAMLIAGKNKQFLSDFWNAKEYVSSGIQQSAGLMDLVYEELMRPRITLPSYMKKLEDAMGGGLLQGRIMNIIGDTSVGKSTHVNGLVYHWLFNAPVKVGVVSLEATAGQYTLDLLSIHLEKNLHFGKGGNEIVDYLHLPEVKALYADLLVTETGESRFAILDERDGDVKKLEAQAEKLIHQFGCNILVFDVLTDVLKSSPADVQESHMKWQKNIVKSGATIINVLHTRKPSQNADGSSRRPTEYDAYGGNSTITSAAVNLVIHRDKMAQGDEKNVTYVDMPKCRGGLTGEIGQWFYDWNTRKVYDYEVWLENKANIYPKTEQSIDNGSQEQEAYEQYQAEQQEISNVTPSTDRDYVPDF